MAQTSDTLLMRTLRLVGGLVGRGTVQVSTGWETRLDNIQAAKECLYIEIYNPGPFAATVTDVSLGWLNPVRFKTVKSIIVGEIRHYPVTVRPRVRWRIHLLPSLINLPQLHSVNVKLANGQEVKHPVNLGDLSGGYDERAALQ